MIHLKADKKLIAMHELAKEFHLEYLKTMHICEEVITPLTCLSNMNLYRKFHLHLGHENGYKDN